MVSKKAISSILTFLLTIGFTVGCSETPKENSSNNNQTVQEEVKKPTDNSESNKKAQNDKDNKKDEDKNKNEMNLVIVENEYMTMTILEKYEDKSWDEVGYKVKIENKSDIDLLIGIDGVSVDGVMNDPFWATTVTAGKTSYENIYWYLDSDDNQNIKSIDDLKNVEFELSISDDETWDTLYNESIVIE